MSLVSPSQAAAGEEITAAKINDPVNQLAAGVNSINDAQIVDVSGTKLTDATVTAAKMATAANPETRFSDSFFDHVASGCVWTADAAGSTLLGSMTAGVVYISGKRITVSAVTAHAFTASKDTYVDIDSNGTVTYAESTNNAASQALASGSIRVAIVVSGATSIAAASSINQGHPSRVLPIRSSVPMAVTDELGNLICPRDPNRKILGYRQLVAAPASCTTNTATQITGLSVPVIIPAGRKAVVRVTIPEFSPNGLTTVVHGIWDGTVGTTELIEFDSPTVAVSGYYGSSSFSSPLQQPSLTSNTSKTYNVSYRNTAAATVVYTSAATNPIHVTVELV